MTAWIRFQVWMDDRALVSQLYYAAAHGDIKMARSYIDYIKSNDCKISGADLEWIVTAHKHHAPQIVQMIDQII
jgi:hypothetical protein